MRPITASEIPMFAAAVERTFGGSAPGPGVQGRDDLIGYITDQHVGHSGLPGDIS